MFRRLGITSVVAANALSQILARTDVASSGFLAAQHVTIKHSSAIGNHIELVRAELRTCGTGHRSTISSADHHYLVPFCNIARVALLRSEWPSFPSLFAYTTLFLSSPWNHQRCGGECAQSNSRKNRRSVVRFSGCATRNNKTFFSHW